MIQRLLKSEELKNESRNSDKSFTRKRKLSFDELVMFLLKGAARTLTVEIDHFFKSIQKEIPIMSKQAVSKARMKLKYETFIKLNDAAIAEYYKEEYETYKGYRLLAADGSMIELPYGEAIKKEFGNLNHNDAWINCGWSVVIYDVLNEMIVDAKLHKYGQTESVYLEDQLKSIKKEGKEKRDIIITDRGFPSLALFVKLRRMNLDFIMRYNGEQFLKEFKELVNNEKDDMIIEVSLTASDYRRINPELQKLIKQGANQTIKLRVVKIKLPNGIIEYLVTSILDKELLTYDDLQQIYNLRWGEEEHFKFEKGSAEIENLSGRTPESIRQDYYSRILILNLHSILVQEAEKQIAQDNEKKKLKYDRYKVNRNVSYGLVHNRIIELLNEENGDWSKAYDELVVELKRHKIPVIEGRNNPREKKWMLKFSPNKRRAI
jgi:Transposase DDE domain